MFFRVIVFCFLLGFVPAGYAATVPPQEDFLNTVVVEAGKWRVVGGDPCRKNPRCTAAWAMGMADRLGVLPPEIAKKAVKDFETAEAAEAAGKEPQWNPYQLCKGEVVDTSFGAEHLRFAPRMTTAFEGCVAGNGFTYFDAKTMTTYEVFKVKACGNYTIRTLTSQLGEYLPGGLPALAANPLGQGPTTPIAWTTPPPWGGTTPPGGGGCRRNCGPPPPPPPPPPPAPIPLPATLPLLLFGLGIGTLFRRRRG